MSHFSTMRTRIRDQEMLVHCLREMGYEVSQDATIRGYSGSRRVDVAIRSRTGYEIGLVRGTDGCFNVVADWWGVSETDEKGFRQDLEARFEAVRQEMEREIAEVQRKAKREYALKTALTQLEAQGFQIVTREEATDGTVRLLARRWQ